MKFLIYYSGDFSQVDEEGLTQELLTNIEEEDARVFRWNPAKGEYEEYYASDYSFIVVETYSDNEDEEQQEHKRTLAGLHGVYGV